MKVVLALTLVIVVLPCTDAAKRNRKCPTKCTVITDKIEEKLKKGEQALAELEKKLKAVTAGGILGGGAVYTRWGRKECPEGAAMIYSGIAGGSHYSHGGGGSNYLCLPRDPQFGKTTTGVQGCGGYLYGTEYELCANNDPLSSVYNLHNNDVPCAVCESSRATKLMIPAKQECPTGWQEEYKGFLMTSHHSHHRTEHVCVDETPVGDQNGHENKDGALMYLVEARCGSLPCPNYVEGYELTCVVCTK